MPCRCPAGKVGMAGDCGNVTLDESRWAPLDCLERHMPGVSSASTACVLGPLDSVPSRGALSNRGIQVICSLGLGVIQEKDTLRALVTPPIPWKDRGHGRIGAPSGEHQIHAAEARQMTQRAGDPLGTWVQTVLSWLRAGAN